MNKRRSNMKTRISLICIVSILSWTSIYAQTFNPKVEVVNDYQGKLVDVTKKDVRMDVPDSLLKFRYTVDYSVFESPYQGSYNFQPYRIDMKPDKSVSSRNSLYLNMGAGYVLSPELDLVFSPKFKKKLSKFNFSVYDTFRGYMDEMDDMTLSTPTGSYDGLILDNRAGISVRYPFAQYVLEVDCAHSYFRTDGPSDKHLYQGGQGLVRLLPVVRNAADYFYGGMFYVNAGMDDFSYETVVPFGGEKHKLGVNDVGAEFTLGKNLDEKNQALCDVGARSVIYSGAFDGSSTSIWIIPRYTLKWNSGYAEAGVKVAMLTGADNEAAADAEFSRFSRSSQYIFPHIKLRQFIIPDHISFRTDIYGGDELNCYSDLMRSNPFANPMYALYYLDSSTDCINANAGFDFEISRKLHLGLGAGYDIRKHSLTDAMGYSVYYDEIADAFSKRYFAYYNYCDYNILHADADFTWVSSRLELNGKFRYQMDDIVKNSCLAMSLPDFSGEISATFNWNHRIFVGLSAWGQSKRDGLALTYSNSVLLNNTYFASSVAGFVDLGAHASFKINPRWTIWVKGGNLLGQRVQKYFLQPFSERMYMGGFSFNL